MANHTPGPWSRDRERDGRFRDESAGVRGPDNNFIAAAFDFNRTDRDDEVEANARLIAAAPELLVAVELAQWLLDRVAGWDGDGEPITKFAARLHGDTMRVAIAKAEGRTDGR